MELLVHFCFTRLSEEKSYGGIQPQYSFGELDVYLYFIS